MLTDYNPGVPKVTNFEHYREQLLEMANAGHDVALSNGKLCSCFNTRCDDCDWRKGEECSIQFIKWGFQEYKEQMKISDHEYHFLILMGSGYIFRDNHKQLYWCENPPSKIDGLWTTQYGDVVKLSFIKALEFPFIKFEGDAWSVERLLELELKA